jgi:GNAT superfamily N-acetyltransferase
LGIALLPAYQRRGFGTLLMQSRAAGRARRRLRAGLVGPCHPE